MRIPPLTSDAVRDLLRRAVVPEHSAALMQAMSGGRAFVEQEFLFVAAEDWLMGIGYRFKEIPASGGPPQGNGPGAGDMLRPEGEAPAGDAGGAAGDDPEAFSRALDGAVERTGATRCFAVGPVLPARLERFIENRDRFYLLPTDAGPPPSLRGPLAKAAQALEVREGRDFTPEHRRLWSEFLARTSMRPSARGLYARTEAGLAASCAAGRTAGREAAREAAVRNASDTVPGNAAGPDVPGNASGDARGPGRASPCPADDRPLLDLRLLSAYDREGNVAAALLLDYSADDFCAYIIGAHSREHYAAHATDLLFAAMLERARAEGKGFIHLGLGVNPGITRFKKKWGGQPGPPFVMASWQERRVTGNGGADARRTGPGASPADGPASELARSLLEVPPGLSKRQIFETFPEQRRFGMIFEVRKREGVCRPSYLCGSAHFFRYSFEMDFRDLFAPLDAVVFEGPLDEDFLAAVERSGRSPARDEPRVADLLDEADLTRLERAVYGPQGRVARLLGLARPRPFDLRALLADARPWFAFFSTWVAYLERRGWHQSVDLEAWRTARDMGVPVVAMEDLDEQLASLESVPLPRIVDFFRRCGQWPAYARRNVRTYLAGDLAGMMGSSIEFPSRTEQVIDHRDGRFRQRMRPFLDDGNCAVFVGTAHLVGLIPMLEADGFELRLMPRGLLPKLRARLGRRFR